MVINRLRASWAHWSPHTELGAACILCLNTFLFPVSREEPELCHLFLHGTEGLWSANQVPYAVCRVSFWQCLPMVVGCMEYGSKYEAWVKSKVQLAFWFQDPVSSSSKVWRVQVLDVRDLPGCAGAVHRDSWQILVSCCSKSQDCQLFAFKQKGMWERSLLLRGPLILEGSEHS